MPPANQIINKSTAKHAEHPLIELKDAGVFRDGRWLVRNINLTVSAGEIVTLIGPNGSGKSTTAKMALHIIKPDEGFVSHQSNVRIGYVPQKLNLDRTLPLSVERLMTLTAKVSKKESLKALERVGIAHLLKAQIVNLSGGELQRALIARAIARNPNILVLDEPVQGVDFNGEAVLYELIQKIRDETGCAILLISHDLHLVMAATDRVLCLNGHICCSGTPEEVSASPDYMRLFGARAALPLAVYQHQHDHTHLADGRVLHTDGTITDNCHHEDGHHNHKGGHHA
ncbi:zinc ABC transporter ATP-binding protein ZnuC [Paenochrobactrum pullorum]|uniref:zinc ABC transporter ATP-binding protein ZnuC n=1 Tax=Paenochrobactrum pullorum TaxID=1324351 RepID=UPI0035BBEEC2